MSTDPPNTPLDGRKQDFVTRQWSVVLAAGNHESGDARKALAQLCETYEEDVDDEIRRLLDNVA